MKYKIVALLVKNKEDKDEETSDMQNAPNKLVYEGRSKAIKGKEKVGDEEDSTHQDDLNEVNE